MNVAALAEIVGEQNAWTADGAQSYAVGGLVPPVVAVPGSREEAAAVIVRARESGWSLVPYGGGTQIGTGYPPSRLDAVLSTRRLDRIVDYQPDDMTVTVEPGVTLRGLAERLVERHQFLPLDPPLPDQATVGGTVAAGVTGPLQSGFGTPRDWVIGCRVVGADGQEVRGGGQVVKNVAGYDLPKLYTGSYGTLGLITEITFKVMPHPGASGFCVIRLSDPARAEQFTAAMMDSDLQPAAAVLTHGLEGDSAGGDTGGWELLLQFIHVPEGVEWQLEEARRLAGAVGAGCERLAATEGTEALFRRRDRPARGAFVARIGTLSSRTAEVAVAVASELRKAGLRPWVAAHAVTGRIHTGTDEEVSREQAQGIRAIAAGAGATCVFERVPASLVGQVDPWGAPGPEFRLLKGIKAALDPAGIFSPGRFVGGL